MSPRRRSVVIVILSVLAIGSGWWLFGSSSGDHPVRGEVVQHRFFGRVTVEIVDSNRDGVPDGHYRYSWFNPAGRVGARPTTYREDRNLDGIWDVWVKTLDVNEDGDIEFRVEVDLTGDGEPDWRFKSLDTLSADEAIVERRGW